MAQPVFAGRSYTLSEHLADKGLSGRTAYVDYQFEVTDDSGALCATGRHKIKWILQSEQPGNRP
jgi:predicted heme/steroid binding protein